MAHKGSIPLKIRAGQATDSLSLRALFLKARRQAWPWLDSTCWQEEDFDRVTADEQLWVAEQDGVVLGFASVWIPDNFLHNLFVSPDQQGLGVGKALLTHVQQAFTATGSLKCLVKNRHAVSFYTRQGWQIASQHPGPDGDYYLMRYPK